MFGINKELLKQMATSTFDVASNPLTMGVGITAATVGGLYKLIKDSRKTDQEFDDFKSKSFFLPSGITTKYRSQIRRVTQDPARQMQLYLLSGIHGLLETIHKSVLDFKHYSEDDTTDNRSRKTKLANAIYKHDPISQILGYVFTGYSPSNVKKLIGTPFDKKALNQEKAQTKHNAEMAGIGYSVAQALGKRSVDVLRYANTYEGKMLNVMSWIGDLTKQSVLETMSIRKMLGLSETLSFGQDVSNDKTIVSVLKNTGKSIVEIPGLNALFNIGKTAFNIAKSPFSIFSKIAGLFEKIDVGIRSFFTGGIFKLQSPEEIEKKAGIYKTDAEKANQFVGQALPNLLARIEHTAFSSLKVQTRMVQLLETIAKINPDNKFIEEIAKSKARVYNPITGQFTDDDTYSYMITRALNDIYKKSFVGRITSTFGGVTDMFLGRSSEERYQKELNRVEKVFAKVSEIDKRLNEEGYRKGTVGYNEELSRRVKGRIGKRTPQVSGLGEEEATTLGSERGRAEAQTVRASLLGAAGVLSMALPAIAGGLLTGGVGIIGGVITSIILGKTIDKKRLQEAQQFIKTVRQKEQSGRESQIINDMEKLLNKVVPSEETTTSKSKKISFTPSMTSNLNSLSANLNDDGVTTGDKLLYYASMSQDYKLTNIYDAITECCNSSSRKRIQVADDYYETQKKYADGTAVLTSSDSIVTRLDNITDILEECCYVTNGNLRLIISNSKKNYVKERLDVLQTRQREQKLLSNIIELKETINDKIVYYLRDIHEYYIFQKNKKNKEPSLFSKLFSKDGLIGGLFSGLFTGASAAGGILAGGFLKKTLRTLITPVGKVFTAGLLTGLVKTFTKTKVGQMFTGVFKNVFEGLSKNKIVRMLGKSIKFPAKLFLNVFKRIPFINVLFGGYDAIKGWKNAAEITDQVKPTFFHKLGAGFAGVLSGLTFGLVPAKLIYKSMANVGDWISDKLSNIGSYFTKLPVIKQIKEAYDYLTAPAEDVQEGDSFITRMWKKFKEMGSDVFGALTTVPYIGAPLRIIKSIYDYFTAPSDKNVENPIVVYWKEFKKFAKDPMNMLMLVPGIGISIGIIKVLYERLIQKSDKKEKTVIEKQLEEIDNMKEETFFSRIFGNKWKSFKRILDKLGLIGSDNFEDTSSLIYLSDAYKNGSTAKTGGSFGGKIPEPKSVPTTPKSESVPTTPKSESVPTTPSVKNNESVSDMVKRMYHSAVGQYLENNKKQSNTTEPTSEPTSVPTTPQQSGISLRRNKNGTLIYKAPTGKDYKLSDTVYDAIQQASNKYNVPMDYMMAMAARESGFDPNIKAPTSSATGLYQFIDSTWNQYYPGKDRRNPYLNAEAAARYAIDNAKTIGRSDPLAMYAGHFMGSGRAKDFFAKLKVNPDRKIDDLLGFSSFANSNPSIAYKNGQPVTYKELYKNIERTMPFSSSTPSINYASAMDIIPKPTKRNQSEIGNVGENDITETAPQPVQKNEEPKSQDTGKQAVQMNQKKENKQPVVVANPPQVPPKVTTKRENYVQEMDPIFNDVIDKIFASVVSSFMYTSSKGFVFGESLNANPLTV